MKAHKLFSLLNDFLLWYALRETSETATAQEFKWKTMTKMFTSGFKEGHDGFQSHSLKHQCRDQRTTATCCPLTATLRTATLTGQKTSPRRKGHFLGTI